ncbi:MAG: peptidoglycan DD-metalloendopeptidase family protein [Burkholderiaceae bacterium]|nr:peptidoglycan DD-metalloendopeptidase family protein [Burkholderiaceae bacterium]
MLWVMVALFIFGDFGLEQNVVAKESPIQEKSINDQINEKKSNLINQKRIKKEEIKNLEKSIKRTKKEKKQIERNLVQTAKKIKKARQSILTIRQEKRKLQKKIHRQNTQIESLRQKIAQEQKIVDEVIRQQLELMSSENTPEWVEKSDNKLRNKVLLDLLAKQSKDLISKLNVQKKRLEKLVYKTEKSKNELLSVEKKETKEQKQLLDERRKRQHLANLLQREVNNKQLTIKRLKQTERRLDRLIANLGKNRNIKKQKSQSLKEQLKAYYPVNGKVVARYGQKRNDKSGLGTWKGMIFSVKDERPVKAVRAGKVVFSDYLRGYGNMIIIDHGKGYFTVYGNNSSLEKDIGDYVQAGETISRVGSKENDLTILYFELRYKGKPIDPAKWLNV